MNESYKDLPTFPMRLSETAAWCMQKSIESNPAESADIRKRRLIGEEAGKLSQRAFLSEGPSLWKWFLRRRSSRLFAWARLGEIKPPLTKQLRSPFLQPAPFESRQSPTDRAQIVEALSDKRAERLRTEQRYPSTVLQDLAGGRLLLYSPDENLCDGAAQYSSMGFFDVDNAPPWDTWVCFFETYLVSWVPPQLLDLANQGIDANPEQCILWARDAGLPNA